MTVPPLGFRSRQRATGAHPMPSGADRGETLAEVLVTMILMGFGFILVFGALFTVAKSSELNTRRTKASNGIQAWGEGLQQPARTLSGNTAVDQYTYDPCAYAGVGGMDNFRMPVGAVPNGAWRSQAIVTKVEILTGWSGTSPVWKSLASEADRNACLASNEDKGLQRITLRVSTPAGETPATTDTLTVVRRNQRCPDVLLPSGDPAFNNADLGPC
jgi:hypothetical protein